MSLSFIKFIYSTLGPHPPARLGDQAPELSEVAFAKELHLGVKASTFDDDQGPSRRQATTKPYVVEGLGVLPLLHCPPLNKD